MHKGLKVVLVASIAVLLIISFATLDLLELRPIQGLPKTESPVQEHVVEKPHVPRDGGSFIPPAPSEAGKKGGKAHAAEAKDLKASDPLPVGIIQPFSTKKLAIAKEHQQPVFIHFTGEGCTQCHFEWMLVDIDKLLKVAKEKKIVILEANLIPGNDNTDILSQMQERGIGGVPAYVFLTPEGKFKVLRTRLWSEGPLVDAMNKWGRNA